MAKPTPRDDWRGPSTDVTRLRALAPVIFVLAGLAVFVYGAGWHTEAVLVEVEMPPLPELPGSPDFLDPFGGGPGPAILRPKQTMTVLLREPALIKDATVGGITRLPSGALKRTYSGDAPAQCPT